MDSDQIVTCGGMDCSVCSVLSVTSSLFHYLLDISAVLAVLLAVAAGFFYLLGRGNEERLNQAKRILIFAVFGFALTLSSFIVILFVYLFSDARGADGWYRVDCNVDSVVEAQPQPPENIADTSYLANKEDSIVDSGEISSIVSGDNRIVRLKPDQIDPDNMVNDIQMLDPERKLNFVAGDKNISDESVIDFRNVDLGFEKDKAADYEIQKGDEMVYVGDKLTSPDEKVRSLLSVSTTDAEDFFGVEWGGDIRNFLGSSSTSTDKKGIEKIATSLKKVAQVAELGGKDIYAYTSGEPSLIGRKYDNCENSGGEMIEFRNPCFANKEHYGSRNLKCSNVYNPMSACDCPSGFYLAGEKCVDVNKLNKGEKEEDRSETEEGDRGKDEKEKTVKKDETRSKKVSLAKSCADISLEEHICPASRCEGDEMMIYPNSVKDECLESLQGPQVTKKFCEGQTSGDAAENQKCKEALDKKSQEEIMKEAKDYYNKYGKSPDWYDKILDEEFGKGQDFKPQTDTGAKVGAGKDSGTTSTIGSASPESGDMGNGSTGSSSIGTSERTPDTGGRTPADTGPLPPDQGAGNFNPTPAFQELKECIGLSGDQIPYNGILVVLLHPENFDKSDRFLVNNHNENISRMFYLSRDGKVIGKNGEDLGRSPMAGGQEYGARDFSKGASNRSMWGRGFKIFKGPTKYWKGGWTDNCSFGSHDGYKIGDYARNDQGNLGGGKVLSMGRCGQHVGKKGSSAGCATMGNNSRCGFINKVKSYMTQSNGTIMQINLKGEMDANGKFKSPDCGKVDYCGAKRSFQNSEARKFKNDPNEGYQQGDKRWVKC